MTNKVVETEETVEHTNNSCQCFTCRNKDNIDALIGYYTGSYDALKEIIELTKECLCDNNKDKDLAIKSFMAKLNYELDCNGVLLEEVELKKKEILNG